MSDLTPDSPDTEAPESSPPPQPPQRRAAVAAMHPAVIGLAGVFGVLLIVYFIMWFYAAGKIEQGVERFVAQANAQGNRIAYKSIKTSGFPGKVHVDLMKVDAFLFGGDNIRIPHLAAEAKAWSWRRVDFDLPEGATFLLTHNVVFDGITTEEIHGDAYFGRLDGLPVISVNAGNTVLSLTPPFINKVTDFRRRIMAQKLTMSFEPDESKDHPDAFRFRLGGDVIGLLNNGESQINEDTHYIEKVTLDTYLPLPPPSRLTREQLTRWRKDGGQIEVKNAEVTWWPVHMTGGGTVGLTDTLQPDGRLDLEITGFKTLVDMLGDAGFLNDNARNMAQIGLSLLARRREGEDTPFVEVPLEIRDNALYLGPVRIMKIDPVAWPGDALVIRH